MIRRFSISIVGRVSATLIQTIVYAMFARSLGVSTFGAFALALSVSFGLLAFLDLGMGTRVLRGIRTTDDRRALGAFVILRYATVLVVPLVAGVVASILQADPLIAVIASIYAVGEASGDLAVGAFQGRRKSVTAMTALLTRRLCPLIILIVLPSLSGALFAASSAGILGLVWFAIATSSNLARPANVFDLIKQNAGIIFSSGASNLASLDVVVVGFASGSAGAGLYASAVRLFNPLNLAVSTLLQVFVPELATSSGRTERLRVFKRVRLLVIVVAALLMASSFLAPTVLVFLFGPEYSAAAPVAVAVFLCAGLSAIAQVHLSWFYASSVPAAVPISMWVSVLAGLAVILVLSSMWGILGSAIGLVSMHLLSLCAIVGCWGFFERVARNGV